MRYLADVNLWLALAFEKHIHCERAWAFLDQLEENSCFMCRMTQQGFLRLATNPKVMSPPLKHREAWSAYDKFLNDERIEFAEEPPELQDSWRRYSKGAKYSPKIWNDAYLAAFASKARMRLLTFDKGFKAYEGLSLELLG